MCPEDVNEVRSDDADEPDELLSFRCNFLTTSRFAFAATRFFKRVFEKLTQRSTQGRASGNFTWSIQVLILIAHNPLAADTMNAMAAVSDNARWQGHGNSKAKLVRNPSAKTGMRPLALWANPDRARGSPLLAMAPMAWPTVTMLPWPAHTLSTLMAAIACSSCRGHLNENYENRLEPHGSAKCTFPVHPCASPAAQRYVQLLQASPSLSQSTEL